MAFISEVPEEQADPALRQTYAQIRQELGFLPHLWQAVGSRPDILRVSMEFWHLLFRKGVLAPELKEKIALVVSAANADSYCIAAHLEMLQHLGVDRTLGEELVVGYEAAKVPEREKALFRFAEKLTREPFEIKEPDVAELRRHGFDDAAILETSLVASHFNFLNRLAAALGVVPDF